MRITFVNRLAGIQWGGGESFDLESARALRRLGHEVHFVIGRRLTQYDLPLYEFPTTTIRTPYLRWLMYRYELHALHPLRTFAYWAMKIDLDLFERAAYRTILRTRLDAKTDVFQINGLPRLGAWLRTRRGAASSIVWHGPPDRTAARWNAQCSATFAFGDSLEAARRFADPRAVEILPGVDLERFQRRHQTAVSARPGSPSAAHEGPGNPAAARVKLGIPSGAIVCLFVGRMIPIKNLPRLLEAFARARAAEPRLFLLLVGDGPRRAGLESQADAMGLRTAVRFAGRREGDELAESFALADVLALSSDYENFPFVILEAMAAGLPVVAPRVGGIPRLVHHEETGLLADPNSPQALAAALLRLAGDEAMRRRLGERGRVEVERFYSWDSTARQMVELYQSCVGCVAVTP